MIIAVDFDGTLCEYKFPSIGEANMPLITALRLAQLQGHKLILWTCRKEVYLAEATKWLAENHGLYFDAVNEDLPEIKDSEFGRGKSHKVFADIYLDDRNIGIKDFVILLSKLGGKS